MNPPGRYQPDYLLLSKDEAFIFVATCASPEAKKKPNRRPKTIPRLRKPMESWKPCPTARAIKLGIF